MCVLRIHSYIYCRRPEICWLKPPDRPYVPLLSCYPCTRPSPSSHPLGNVKRIVWLCEDCLKLNYFHGSIYGPRNPMHCVYDCAYLARHGPI